MSLVRNTKMRLAVIRKMSLPALLFTHTLPAAAPVPLAACAQRGYAPPGARGASEAGSLADVAGGGLGRIPGTGASVCLLGQRKVFGGARAGDRGWWGGCFVSSMALNTRLVLTWEHPGKPG